MADDIWSSGGTSTYEGFNVGQVGAAFLGDQCAVYAAQQDDVPRHVWQSFSGRMILLNMGAEVNCAGGQPAPVCAGLPDGPAKTSPPTASLKVRRAIAAAIDVELHNERVFNGEADPARTLLGEDFPWYPAGFNQSEYDLEHAKDLVAEAKADGWDGSVRFLSHGAPSHVAESLALQAMLGAAGIDLIIDTGNDVSTLASRVIATKDFDIASWGMGITSDDGAIAAMAQNLLSTSPSNRVGYSNPDVDQAIVQVVGPPATTRRRWLTGQLWNRCAMMSRSCHSPISNIWSFRAQTSTT